MNSFISWIGGKNYLKKEIVKRFPTENYDYYVEVFGGAGWVLFHKDRHAETEVYNDLNGELVNLFRVAKYHCDELKKELGFLLNSREIFEGFKNQNTEYMTDIQRAARFFWIIKTSFGAKGGVYNCVKKDINKMVDYLSAIQIRLKDVAVERKDFEKLINDFNRKNTLFYLDPPYYGTERYYSVSFPKSDHERLFKSLCNTQQKFILSYNDCEQIRDMYRTYNIYEVCRFNSLSTQSGNDSFYKELIITNY
jgi:DNA adenine methylase